MVRSDATKDRLEARMDRPHSSPHYIQKRRRKKGGVPPPRHQSTSTNQKRLIFYRSSHVTPTRRSHRPSESTLTLSTPCKSLQRAAIPKASSPFDLGPCHRTPPWRTPHSP